MLSLAAVLAAPAAADGGIRQEIAAANAVEKRLEKRYAPYRWVASCDHQTQTRFACTFVGRRGTRTGTGKARVVRSGARYRVTILSVRFKR